MSAREVVLLSADELGSGAHEAHFRALARRMGTDAVVHEVALVSPRELITRAGRRRLARQHEAARAALSGRLVVLPHEPRWFTRRLSARALAGALRSLCSSGRPIVHARGALAANIAASARRHGGFALLHDVRGDRVAEIGTFGGETTARVAAELERAACRAADAHACVSAPLRDVLRERHGVAAEVFPCAADTRAFRPDDDARERTRAELDLGDALVLGFIGSAAGWQRPDAIVALFARVAALKPDARLVVLTPDMDAWATMLLAHGISVDAPTRPQPGAPALLRRVDHSEVPRHLAAFDATLLLRDRDAINHVASPIKFGESLACGVPVLLTRGIGDASALVEQRGLGVAFEDALLRGPDDEAALVDFLRRLPRERARLSAACRAVAEESWSWTEQVPRWWTLYRRLWDTR